MMRWRSSTLRDGPTLRKRSKLGLTSRRDFLRIAGSSLLLQAGVTLGAGQATTGEPKRGAIKTSEAPLGYSLQDVADDAHLDFFQVCGGDKSKKYILETTGSGVAFIDYDNDGWLDIFLVNGSSPAQKKSEKRPPTKQFYHKP